MNHERSPDLGMEFLHLLLIDRGLLSAATFKHAAAALKKRAFPLMDHR
ncbi:hypothetical protein MN186_16345 [Aliiroseovarius sp. N1F302]|nr:hypothetical protein [Aliiroseovarius sediminis]MCI2396003.1 hypothetical protein [Aliiroseovarius sediminis]